MLQALMAMYQASGEQQRDDEKQSAELSMAAAPKSNKNISFNSGAMDIPPGMFGGGTTTNVGLVVVGLIVLYLIIKRR